VRQRRFGEASLTDKAGLYTTPAVGDKASSLVERLARGGYLPYVGNTASCSLI